MAKKIICSDRIPAPGSNYSPGFKIGDFIFISGLLATDYETGIPDDAKTHPNFPWFGSDVKLQARNVLENLKKLLEDAGSSIDKIVKASVYMHNLDQYGQFKEVWEEYFSETIPPQTVIEVHCGHYGQGLLGSMGNLFEVEVIALASDEIKKEEIRISEPNLPKNYPLAVKSGDFIFTSGLSPVDENGELPEKSRVSPEFSLYKSEIKLQTKYALEKLKSILENEGGSLSDVIKTNVYLCDTDNYLQFEEVWNEYFPVEPPARTIIEAERLLGARNNIVQIEAISLTPDSEVGKKVISTDIPGPRESRSLAVKAGDLLFTSGLKPEPSKTRPDFWFESEIKTQVRSSLEKMKKLLKKSNHTLDAVAKCNMYLTDLRDYDDFANTLPEYFKGAIPPARTVFEVGSILGPTGTDFSIDAVVDCAAEEECE